MSATCPSFVVVACMVLSHIASSGSQAIAGDFLGMLASHIQSAVLWMFTKATTLWLKIPSPDLAHEPAVTAMRAWLLPVTGAVAAGGMIAAGARMVLTRRANPLLDVGTGLVAIAAAATLGVAVPDFLLLAGDSWSSWVLNVSTGNQFNARFDDILNLAGSSASVVPEVVVIVFGLIALVLGALQAVLLIFRQASVIILAALLPLAAAGATAPLTRAWIRKLTSWMLALIVYKPAAAAVYATAFTMIGTGANLETVLMGFAMMALSPIALPVLIRFFTWTTGAVSSGGGTGALLAGAAAGAAAMGSLRGTPGAGTSTGGTPAAEHASYLGAQQQAPPAGDAAAGAGMGNAAVSSTGSPTGPGTGSLPNRSDGADTAPTTSPGHASSANPASTIADSNTSGTGTAGSPGTAATAASVPGTAGTSDAAGAAGSSAAGTGTTSGITRMAPAGAASVATGGLASAVTTAAMAAKGLADGARDTADEATGDGEQR